MHRLCIFKPSDFSPCCSRQETMVLGREGLDLLQIKKMTKLFPGCTESQGWPQRAVPARTMLGAIALAASTHLPSPLTAHVVHVQPEAYLSLRVQGSAGRTS